MPRESLLALPQFLALPLRHRQLPLLLRSVQRPADSADDVELVSERIGWFPFAAPSCSAIGVIFTLTSSTQTVSAVTNKCQSLCQSLGMTLA